MPRGELVPSSKLRETEVHKIRKMFARGQLTKKELGRIFGVSEYAIHGVVSGTWWAWLKS